MKLLIDSTLIAGAIWNNQARLLSPCQLTGKECFRCLVPFPGTHSQVPLGDYRLVIFNRRLLRGIWERLEED